MTILPIRAALTFDTEHPDRPEGGGTERLVGILAAAGVRATFFLQGAWVQGAPSVASSVVEGGHLVGSHGFDHTRLSNLTDHGIREDVARAEQEIRELAGADPRPWFRCPFGDGASDPRVLARLFEGGYRHVGWNVNPGDWRQVLTEEELERSIREGVRAVGDGAVVLLHGWPSMTPTAVEGVLAAASDDGVTYVGIDELGAPPVATVDA